MGPTLLGIPILKWVGNLPGQPQARVSLLLRIGLHGLLLGILVALTLLG